MRTLHVNRLLLATQRIAGGPEFTVIGWRWRLLAHTEHLQVRAIPRKAHDQYWHTIDHMAPADPVQHECRLVDAVDGERFADVHDVRQPQQPEQYNQRDGHFMVRIVQVLDVGLRHFGPATLRLV